MAGLASRFLTKLLQQSKPFIGWLILDILGLIAICTTAAVAGIALQTSIQHVILSKIGLTMLILSRPLRLR